MGMSRCRVESSRLSISCQGKKPHSKRKGAWSKWQGARGKINTQDAWEVEDVTRGKARHCVRQGKVKGGGIEQSRA